MRRRYAPTPKLPLPTLQLQRSHELAGGNRKLVGQGLRRSAVPLLLHALQTISFTTRGAAARPNQLRARFTATSQRPRPSRCTQTGRHRWARPVGPSTILLL